MIVIDYNDKRPIYEQVTDRLRTLIINGVFEADSKLPSVRSLAIELSINPNTIQRAFSELEHEGLIYSVKGRGNYVKADLNVVTMLKKQTLDSLRLQFQTAKDQDISKEEIIQTLESVYTPISEENKEEKA